MKKSSMLVLLLLSGSVLAEDSLTEQYMSEIESNSLDSIMDLPTIMIASGYNSTISSAPATASVITAEDLKNMGAMTIDEALESIPGVHVARATSHRAFATYSIRGVMTSFTPQVLFLLNGQRIVSDHYTSAPGYLAKMNVESIEQIEVIRGPGSAVYGADAFSGIINIVTKSAKTRDGLDFGVRGGSDDTQNVWMNYMTDLQNDWKLSSSVEWFSRGINDGQKVSSDHQTVYDDLFDTSASLAPGVLDDGLDSAQINLHLTEKNWHFGYDGYFIRNAGQKAGAVLAIDRDGEDAYDMSMFTASYMNDTLVDNLQLETTYTHLYSKIKSDLYLFPAGSVYPVGNDGNLFTPHDGDGCQTTVTPYGCMTTFINGVRTKPRIYSNTDTLDVTGIYEGISNHKIRLNIGTKYEDWDADDNRNRGLGVLDKETLDGQPNPIVVDDTVYASDYQFYEKGNRNIYYGSLQDEWFIDDKFSLTTGVRLDDYSDYGTTTNFRGGLIWTPTAKIVTKFLYGESFRSPSGSEKYSVNTITTLGNKDLSPEEMKTTEIGFRYEHSSKLDFDLNVYYYTAEGLIDFVEEGAVKRAQNNRKLTGKGMEFETHWSPFPSLKLNANYAYQHVTEDDTDDNLEYIPNHQVYVNAVWKFKQDWTFSTQVNWVGEREEDKSKTYDAVEAQTLTNMTLRRTNIGADKKWELAVIAKNIFDEDLYEPSTSKLPDNYPLEDRRFFLEIRYNW